MIMIVMQWCDDSDVVWCDDRDVGGVRVQYSVWKTIGGVWRFLCSIFVHIVLSINFNVK